MLIIVCNVEYIYIENIFYSLRPSTIYIKTTLILSGETYYFNIDIQMLHCTEVILPCDIIINHSCCVGLC